MGAVASLGTTRILVEPGGEATCQITVSNTSHVVDEFTLTVVGDPGAWATVDPPTISLFPGAEASATIRFNPPRSSSVDEGPKPFAVRVTSKEDPAGSVAEEGTVEVGTFAEVTAELLPRTSKGRRRAVHEIAVDNRGNRVLNAELSAWDENEGLGFEFTPPGLVVNPGEASFTKLEVRPVRRFLRGPDRTHQFKVSIESDVTEPMTLAGTMVQQALVPKWLPKALLALAALLLLLALLWFTILKPTVESAARDAVEEEVQDLQEKVAAAEEAAADAQQAAEDAGAGDPVAGGEVPTLPPATDQGDLIELGDSFDTRLEVTTGVGGSDTDAFVVPDGQRFLLADVVLQNPQGDSGLLQLKRDGTILIEVSLENFRDLDYHFVAPVIFRSGEALEITMVCTETTGPSCRSAAYVAGFISGV